MNKRGNNEGSITHLADGRWQARITLDGGKRKAFYGATRAEAAKKLTAALRDRDRGLPVVAERQTLAQYLTYWLAVVKPSIRPRTWQRYSELMTLHVLPHLGATTLAKLSAQQVQQFYGAKLDAGLSSTTVHHLHAVLHKALARAERLGLVARNVCDLLDGPRMAHKEMQVLDRMQTRILLQTAHGDRLEALYVLAVSTGMRQGEILALRWHDVDLATGIVQVRATLQRTKEEGYTLAAPKTKQSQRRIKLGAIVVAALRDHRARQLHERLALGSAWEDHDLVFPNTVGKPMDGMNLLHYHFYPLLKRAGLARVRFHDLRHTAATLMLSEGINPKIVSERLGHATVSITLDIYSHVLPDMQDQAATAMDGVIGL